ncbi:MAG: acyl--CoA ligase [Alistipes sp.]|nr:acyl--CoA ligase [Alistipes sp.]
MENKKLTGYPSVDKPWLKYYSEEAINLTVPRCTIYEYLYERNKGYLNDIAIDYAGRKITYGELFKQIDQLAVSFSEEGIKRGDIVTIIAPSFPEVIYSFYVLNKIGAISNFIDPRKTSAELEVILSRMNTKACIVMDSLWEKFFEVIRKHTSMMISVSAADSLQTLPKALVRLKGKGKRNEQIITMNRLKKSICI